MNAPEKKPIRFSDPVTIRLKEPAFIHLHNYQAGDTVTLNRDRANALVEEGKAGVAPLDLSRVPEEGRARPYIRTASIDPARNKGATITGKGR